MVCAITNTFFMDKNYQGTEGEKVIEYYLEDQNIKFIPQVQLPNLKGDTKNYRVADFYLPQYRVYLEFLGRWNVADDKSVYIEKMKIYADNKIPCIYIYPENLGALGLLFNMRMEEQFKTFPDLRVERLKFRFWKLKKTVLLGLLLWMSMTLLLVFAENIYNGKLAVGLVSLWLPLLFFVALMAYALKLIFLRK